MVMAQAQEDREFSQSDEEGRAASGTDSHQRFHCSRTRVYQDIDLGKNIRR